MRPWRDNLLKRRKRNDQQHVAPADRRLAGNVISRTDPNISSFDGNATLGGADDESEGAYLAAGIKLAISVIWAGSELAEQQQDQQHHQNQSANPHSRMAHAVAIAAETAAEAAQQEDDQDDDEDQAERHGPSP